MYIKEPMEVYINDAASGKSTPGGGSVSALIGALGGTMEIKVVHIQPETTIAADADDLVHIVHARWASIGGHAHHLVFPVVDPEAEERGEG